MAKGFRHLTYENRCQIYALLKSKLPVAKIANALATHRSTIYRELKRNSYAHGYHHMPAQAHANRRKRNAKACRAQKRLAHMDLVKKYLTESQWSPEQISGYLKRHHGIKISHEKIYQFIWRDKKRGGSLHKHLRHGRKLYYKRRGSYKGRGRIPGRVDISERPKLVDKKQRIGDWEIDTILGKGHKAVIISIVERVSKFTLLRLVTGKKSKDVNEATKSALKPLASHVHTITSDNGREFVRHEDLSRALEAKVFFARPYHAWERGLNEHTNGLVRQYFPKNVDLRTVTPKAVHRVENLLNKRPRKVLKYKTPYEVFTKALAATRDVALQT